MPNSDLIMKPEWINLQALESTITLKARDTETLALILRPFAELPKWAYVDLGNVVEEAFTCFKNIDPKSSSGFIVVYEELLTVLLRSSSLKTHYGPDGESVIGGAGIKKYPNLEHKLTKNATESKIKFEQQFDTATLLNITDVDIDSLVVEERNIATEEASITKRIPLKYKSLCLSEMAQHNIQHPTFQWDVKAFQEYPLQSDFCTKTIMVVSAIVEQWLRGQKASYGMIVIKQPAQGYHLIAILKNSLMASMQPTNYHLVFKNHVCNLINTYFSITPQHILAEANVHP
ncbi:hypothetical protein PPACK8108_LOCUS3493 [Phakopsora pachyrhizi]|uniref:Uncharacterized protein n=1 Tax=Phakopsora pachyrhizi TaxID=170000 RepID=A0AAV0AN41_PHAPC|nr:hypothetical protein PPACK8108_LOCUS3493 [Phakopsora pachyrhizi]